ncbi:MAG: hypothetical protein CL555_21175 [Algoriphagus sp.]|jgi:GNAT superfamily N-acetyltransferase|nr:hypothetical protein [Algoriphagus sp.]|tara:strand:+ start:174 stop:785 length:612 start_codon:yes stop_codon:yes gene_type:complete
MSETPVEARVRFATSDEQQDVLDACMDAFGDEAVLCWVVPRAQDREAMAREMFSARLMAALKARQVIVAVVADHKIAGVALVRHEAEKHDTPVEAQSTIQHSDELSKRFAYVARTADQARPRNAHILIDSIAVRGRSRGRGIGTMLIEYCIELADHLAEPLFLMASTPGSVRLYKRHGFQEQGDSIALPDDGPHLQPMWRGMP